MSTTTVALTIEPLAVDKETAAAMLGNMSASTLETLSRTEPLLQPVELSTRRVGYPVENLKAWLRTRPKSTKLTPENCGIGSSGKRVNTTAEQPAERTPR